MKVLKRHIFLAGMLISAMSVAAASTPAKSAKSSKTATAPAKTVKAAMKVEGSAKLAKQMEIYEHAAANRELAGLTQMEHAKNLEEQAAEASKTKDDADLATYKTNNTNAGALEKSAAALYGKAAANFDKASANRTKVASISKKLGKVEQYRNSQVYATNLKLQANEAMQNAADACEAAAVAYDKAEDLAQVALNSQMAATWLEKLALR